MPTVYPRHQYYFNDVGIRFVILFQSGRQFIERVLFSQIKSHSYPTGFLCSF
jgi:hypothetical protein